MTLNANTLVGPFTAAQATKLYNNIDSDLQPISVAYSNSPFGGNVYATYTSATGKSRHVATVGCRNLRLVYKILLQGTVIGTPEELPANPFEMKVSLETSTGTLFPVYFSGNRLTLCKPGALLISDPIGVSLAANEVFHVRTFINRIASASFTDNVGESGFLATDQANLIQSYSARGVMFANGEGAVFSTSTGVNPFLQDFTDSGSVAQSSNIVFAPSVILGIPEAKISRSVVILGDSISYGAGDVIPAAAATIPNSNYTQFCFGHWTRAFGAANIAYFRAAMGGEQCADWVTNAKCFNRQSMINNSTALIALGTNDIASGGASADTLKANLLTLIAKMRNYTDKVYISTILPRALSTDGYVTLTNQTTQLANNFNNVKNEVNDWMRAGGTRIPVIDMADAAESSRNSGKWKAGTILVSGTATGGSATTIVDAGKSWTTNEWTGYVATNNATGQSGYISSNTATTLTCIFISGISQFSPVPGSGDAYTINASYTADGTHPSSYGFKQLTSAVPVTMFG